MIPTPTTWIVNQSARVDVVLHRRASRHACIIREVLSGRILVELVDVPQQFWVGAEEVHEDGSSTPRAHPEAS